MNVSLTQELERLVNEKVKSGMYQTSSEVVREGLRLLKERDEHHESLRRDVLAGIDAIERGDYTTYQAASVGKIADQVKRQGRRRLANAKRTNGAK